METRSLELTYQQLDTRELIWSAVLGFFFWALLLPLHLTALQFTAVQGLAGPQGRESVVQPMESTVNLTPLSTVSLALAAFL